MALDNSLYDSLQETYFILKNYLETVQLIREHSPLILKQEEMEVLLENLDIEAIEEQSKDITSLHDELNDIKTISQKVAQDIESKIDTALLCENTLQNLEEIFGRINKIIV